MEFALVVPLVLLILVGVVQYGYHYWAMQTAAASAREAARRLIVGTDPTCTVAEAQDRAGGPAVGTLAPSVVYRYHNATNTAKRGALVTVTVTIQSLDIGLVPLPSGGVVTQSATNRVENVPVDPLLCVAP
ncbi:MULTISPECIES: TadE/TadG family type IV pilus assembly protein [unclassified Nocardioides]|uniref:TadE/TadG family type IV pilus assembly protein n=1 Tax=unclassified Nocardioides TaxID=2615069 RepID=UPI000AF1AAFE|nr:MULTISPECIES: TadE/TadG family type IV pilus assembly protein [unclassified Nocardioides]